MKKLFLLILFSLILIQNADALSIVSASWETINNIPIQSADSILLNKGDVATFQIHITSFEDTISYGILIRKNSETPHEYVPLHLIDSSEYQEGAFGSIEYQEFRTFTTSDLEPGTYELYIYIDDNLDTLGEDYYVLYLTVQDPQQNHAPSAPIYISPKNAETDVSINVELDWLASTDQDDDEITYILYFTDDYDNFGPAYEIANGLTGTSYQLEDLDYGTTYYWRVLADDGIHQVPGPIWSFTTQSEPAQNHPPTINLLYPADNQENIEINPLLKWEAYDQDNDMLSFEVWVRAESEPDYHKYNAGSNEEFRLNNLQYDTTYYWRVSVSDGQESVLSSEFSFTTILNPEVENHPPSPPFNPYPAHSSTNISLDLTLSWDSYDQDGDNLYYDLYFGESGNLIKIATNLKIPEYYIDNLDYNTVYQWYVVVKDQEYNTIGQEWKFKTIEQPQQNHAPTINQIPDQYAEIGSWFELQIDAYDQDNDTLTFQDNSDLFEITDSGLIKFVPAREDEGTYNIEITVTDEHGSSAKVSFKLTIYEQTEDTEDDEIDWDNVIIVVEKGICRPIDDTNQGKRTIFYHIYDSAMDYIYKIIVGEEYCTIDTQDNQISQVYYGYNLFNDGNLVLFFILGVGSLIAISTLFAIRH